MIQSQPYTLKFIKKIEVAKDTYSFYFSRPDSFEFLPGQYNRWSLPITPTDGRGASRFFTISSSPLEKKYLSLTTKIIQSDFKKALVTLKENDTVKIFGPMGEFILDETDTRERIFLAGGIGITPYHSMLLYASGKKLSLPMTLLVSFSIPEEIVFFKELNEIAKSNSTMQSVYTITKPELSKLPWNGETGRISEEMIKKYAKDISRSIFYISGPPAMVDGTKKILEEMKIAEGNIQVEQFTGY